MKKRITLVARGVSIALLALAALFTLMMWLVPRLFGIALIAVSAGIAWWLQKKPPELVLLHIESPPASEEVDAALAQYEREMKEFLRHKTPPAR